MCDALTKSGLPGRRLQLITPDSPYPVQSDIVVVTPAVQGQFGSSLATGWAPDVLGRFGSGSAAVTVRVIARQGAARYQSELAADLKGRKMGGAGLLASRQITASPTARKQLLAGQVDARLIVVLSELAAVNPVDIIAFGTVFAGATTTIPLRMAELAQTDAAAKLDRSDYLRFLLKVLDAQRAVYRPASAGPARTAAGQPVFRIEFAAPSPLGLLGPQGP
jgi:hypothetical protein